MHVTVSHIENKIYTIRGIHVMLDYDLADIYRVEPKVLNQAVKRNSNRFPEEFCFKLNPGEWNFIRLKLDPIDIGKGKHRKYAPVAFTEQGVAMLSAILRSEIAIQVSIQIIQAFVVTRKTMGQLQGVIQRLEGVESKQMHTENKLEQVLRALEKNQPVKQGIFFEGQLFDAHVFASNLIKEANHELIVLDNYVNETTLLMLTKRQAHVKCKIYTRITNALLKDLEKHNFQYPSIELIENKSNHDRFVILDDHKLYHLGASLKDLGNKCFAFSRMDDLLPVLKDKLLV